jgi:nucleoside triphosphatase
MASFPRGIEVVCGTIIENADKQIFLAQSPKWADRWCIPGGHVEPGETVAQASIREGEEETGLKLELVSIIGWGEAIADPEFHRPAHFIYFDAYCKVSNKINNDVKLDTRELTNYCWVYPQEALKMNLISSDRASIVRFIEFISNKNIVHQ